MTSDEANQSTHGHSHDHQGDSQQTSWASARTEMIFSILSGFFLLLGFLSTTYFSESLPLHLDWVFYGISLGFGGFFTLIEAFESLRKFHFEIDFLMLVAAAGAVALGEWGEGALLLFLFSLGHALEHFAMGKARRSIEALSGLKVTTATMLLPNGDWEERPIEEVGLLQRVRVKPNSKIPVDGVVVQGESEVNQAPITGESMPVSKKPIAIPPDSPLALELISPMHRTYSGSINGSGTLEILALRKAEDSTISRIVRMVNEAKDQKSESQLLSDKVIKYYIPSVLIFVTVLLCLPLFTGEAFESAFYRAMAVLVAASPCALAISTPSAVLSGIARAARGGVLFKGGKPLEGLGTLTALVFDKTGTLTQGEPSIQAVEPAEGVTKTQLLSIALAVERQSDHPLARAIVRDATSIIGTESPIPEASDFQTIVGLGLKARVQGKVVFIGKEGLFSTKTNGFELTDRLKQVQKTLMEQGQTTMIVWYDGRFLGIIGLRDTLRPDAKFALSVLFEKIGIKQLMMLSGDNQQVADSIAREIGLTKAYGNLLPQDKVTAIVALQTEGFQVGMVGDGVNDAPAMATSSLGIAMGAAGSDVALETADVALMSDNLAQLPFAIRLSRKTRQIIAQNIWISLGMVAVLVPLTLFGVANMGAAVVLHEGSTVVVVLNALRLLGYQE